MAKQAFSFDDLDGISFPAVVMVYGDHGSGKTHWAAHAMPTPVYVANTEAGRVRMVAAKAKKAGRALKVKSCMNLAGVKDVVRAAIQAAPADQDMPGTFVFDSASDLLNLAVAEYLQETRKDKIYPQVTWARVYAKISSMHEALTRRGFTVVYLCREKAEYVGETKTGEVTHEGFKRLPFMSDVVLRLHKAEGEFEVVSNKFQRSTVKWDRIPAELGWAEISGHLSDPKSKFVAATAK